MGVLEPARFKQIVIDISLFTVPLTVMIMPLGTYSFQARGEIRDRG